jgi:multisubunit Na+/H+ antiporter MnhB subunit
MAAVTRDLDFSSGVFAALATVLFVMCYGAPASWVRAFLLLRLCHGYSFLSTQLTGLLPFARRKMIEHFLHVFI